MPKRTCKMPKKKIYKKQELLKYERKNNKIK